MVGKPMRLLTLEAVPYAELQHLMERVFGGMTFGAFGTVFVPLNQSI